jgi:hypothetical protein
MAIMAGTNDRRPIRLRVTRRDAMRLPLILSGLALVGCGGSGKGPGGVGSELLAWPAKDLWPKQFQDATPQVQEAYRYAVANPEVMRYFPCFCGCGAQGHTSNLDCYVREYRDDESVVLDAMSFG